MRTLKTVGALFLGLLTGMVVVGLVESISAVLHPIPPGVDLHHNPQQFNEFVRSLPASAFLIVLAAWALGTLCSAWVAVRVTPGRPLWPAWVMGGFFLMAAVSMLMMHPHPLWMAVIGVLELPLCAWLGGSSARWVIDRVVMPA